MTIEEILDGLEHEICDGRPEWQARTSKVRRELRALRRELNKARQDYDGAYREWSAKMNHLSETVERTDRERADWQDRFIRLCSELGALMGDVKRLTRERDEALCCDVSRKP